MQLAKAQPLPVGPAASTPFQPVASSWIQGLRWTPEYGAEMTTKNGKHSYPYPGITKAMFKEWLSRKSKGKWWHRHVREAAAQFSRWTGPVHPLFVNPRIDGPIDFGSFQKEIPLHAWLKSKLSMHTTPEHMAALFGWLPGTKLNYYYMDIDKNTGKPQTAYTEVSDPAGHYSAHRSITIEPGQPPQLHNELMSINRKQKHPYTGASGPVLLRQIRAAYELGIPRVDFFAAWQPPEQQPLSVRPSLQAMFPGIDWGSPQHKDLYTGGLHWPVMGADGILPPSYIKRIPRHIVESAQLASRGRFIGSQKISDFFASPEARAYYETDPTAHDAFIDTTPGSYSRRAIEHHVGQNAVKYGHPIPIPDNMMPKKPLHLTHRRRMRYPFHLEHLLATGELHPDHFDAYFDR